MRNTTLVTKQSTLPHIEEWKTINWVQINKYVEKLQQRIYRAEQQQQRRKVRSLQRLLLKSKAALLLSIRRVTQTNKGRKTAGIDNQVIKTDGERLKLFRQMSQQSLYLHNPKPSYRTYIAKKNGKLRPLSIPTIKDRVYQNIAKMALEPQWEFIFESTSYGFRPKRGCHDALVRIFLALVMNKKQWVFEGDFKGCFDNLNHDYILEQVKEFPGAVVIEKWLKSGYVNKGVFHKTESGSGQGSIISPLLANIALHGMEETLGVKYRPKRSTCRATTYINTGDCTVIRYADDFVCLCDTKPEAMALYQKLVPYLEKRGLELETTKTRVVNIYDGFDFLGFNIRRYNVGKSSKLFIKPSHESLNKARERIRKVVEECKGQNVDVLIGKLNPVITGIGNYWRPMVSKRAFSTIDSYIFQKTYQFTKRLHANKGIKWIKKKYYPHFLTGEANKWTLVSPEKKIELKRMSTIHIERHVVIRHNASPYDSKLKEYFEKRKARSGSQSFYYIPSFLG